MDDEIAEIIRLDFQRLAGEAIHQLKTAKELKEIFPGVWPNGICNIFFTFQ